jgi:hypothetical protein
MTKETIIECIDMVIDKRPQVYVVSVMNDIRNFVYKMDFFNYQKVRYFISLQQPIKLGGIEAIEVSNALGFLKDLINCKKKKEKQKL